MSFRRTTSTSRQRKGQPAEQHYGRAERRADLHNRPFAAGRAAATDTQRRGDDFGDDDARPDAPAAQRDGLHRLRHAVAFGLFRKEFDDRAG